MSSISADLGTLYNIEDFTITEYIDLLRIAKRNYRFIAYDEVEFASHFILWRHDCDISLNRALRFAQIERDNNISATYFLNPHSEFYNLLEKNQAKIIEQIIGLNHSIGLHFDAGFYNIDSEHQLDDVIAQEADWLRQWFGIEISVFSFHNPTEFLLTCEKYKYGGLINCYSEYFKQNISYCSDSNGYWRFRRLREILEQAADKNLHILTHAEWWQEKPMLPRDRVLRSVEGRAVAIMNAYDAFLEKNARKNIR